MLVALDVTSFLASQTGVGVTVGELTRALLERAEREGDSLRLCAVSWNAGAGARLRAAFPSPRAEILTRRAPVRFLAPLVDRSAWPDCEALFGAADVFHAGPLLVPASRRRRLVATVYDLTPIRFPDLHIASNTFDRAQLGRRLERAARIVVPSDSTRRDLEEIAGVPRDKIRVVPLGVGPQFRPEAAPLPASLDIDRDYILSVGQIEPRKNLERLVGAFQLLKERRRVPHLLVLAGPQGWMDSPLYRAVRDRGLVGDVRFTGFVSDETLNALYAHAALFVYPSLHEGFGLPPLEAMAAGCPVAVARTGSLPEVVGDAGLYFEPTDVEGIARSIEQILDSVELRDRLRNRGLARSRLFSWQSAAEATWHVYSEVCD